MAPSTRLASVVLVTLVVLCAGSPRTAQGQPYPPLRDRDFALDLYNGGIVGSVRVIGMGGAAIALAQGSVGTVSNAAAPAVRRTTRSDNFAVDFHLDAQTATFAKDFDNNGLDDTDESSSQLATFGIVLQYGDWGLGITATTSSTQIVEDDGDDTTQDGILEPQGTVAKIVLARSFYEEQHAVGIGLRFGSLSFVRPRPGLDDFALFSIAGPSIEAGWIFRPSEAAWRVGAGGALPVAGSNEITLGDCDPLACEGYILPERVEVPWTVSAGGAYRLASTPWNTRVDKEYRDELALLVALDLVVTGGVQNGHGLEAYARHMLQPSGSEIILSPRLGAEAELIPGWLRLRAGTYWEPGRFDGVGGRLHGTAGADVRLFEFPLFGKRYRPQLSFTVDAAPRYGNTGISLGLWR